MIKKLFSFLCACMLFVSIYSFTQSKNLPPQDIKSGFGISINWATYQAHDFSLLLTYDNYVLTAGLGGNYENNDYNGEKLKWFEWRAHLGLRRSISYRLFLAGGVAGTYADYTTAFVNDVYSFGPYVGLDYYLIKKMFLSFKILPYMYAKQWNNTKTSTFFEQGSIALTYTF